MTEASWRHGRAAFAVSTAARTALAVLGLLLLATILPAVAGWHSTVVMSGSMEPAVSPGDVAVVRPVDTADLHPGQVLLVDDPDVPGHLRLHRLVTVEAGGLLQLKGDANPADDSSLVSPAAVHGVGVLRLPDLGLPVLWASEHRVLPLAGTGLALLGVVALALLHRGSDDQLPPSARPEGPSAGRRRTRRARRALGAGAALVVLVAVPATAGATFSATTGNDVNTFAAARYFTCASAAASAPGYFSLQESAGPTAYNTGTYPTANGTYSTAGVSYGVKGPACSGSPGKAVQLDGVDGMVYTTTSLYDPEVFTVQLWFSTRTGSGGKLFGFGNGTDGTASSSYDRHVYMTNSGTLTFGLYDGGYETATTPAAYNDGAWHLVTATFSASTGMRLYVDGALAASRTGVASAEPFTGYWRVGYDTLANWPDAPASEHFKGAVAHASFFQSVLSAGDVAAQYAAGN